MNGSPILPMIEAGNGEIRSTSSGPNWRLDYSAHQAGRCEAPGELCR